MAIRGRRGLSWPLRQIEIYDAGPTLRYGPDRNEDEYGRLGLGRLDESENWPQGEITAAEFEAIWTDRPVDALTSADSCADRGGSRQ